MEVLLAWCNDELRLSRRVTDLQADFANGYLLGEILDKHARFGADFKGVFVDGHRTDAVRNNWAALQPALQRLGVRITANDVRRIVDGGDGKRVASLLYAVFAQLSSALNQARDGALLGTT